jgi:hypothetical protein
MRQMKGVEIILRKRWKIAVFGIIGLLVFGVILSALYIKSVGIDNIKLMYTLNTTDQAIVVMDGKGNYLTKKNHSVDLLKERMKTEGWTYITQEGAGYFFEKAKEETIVTAKIWNSKYVIYHVKDNVVNIADK